MTIQVIVGSTRHGRATPSVAGWVEKTARRILSEHTIELVDLVDYNLPFFDEPLPPLGNKNRHPRPEAQKWLDKLAEAEAYIIVTPEYNHSYPAVLKNALDYVDTQLKAKPILFVGHGSVGGARAIEHLKTVVSSNIGAIPLPDSVNLVGVVAFSEIFTDEHELTEEYGKYQKKLETALQNIHYSPI